MIQITNLTKEYSGGVQALRGIDVEIGTGMFGLVGPNGAGKTTLMRILAGLVRPSDGQVHVFGHDIRTNKGKQAAKALIGYLPQELGFYPDLTAVEFLDYMGILKGITSKHERRHQSAALLELVRLTDVADRKIRTYSGGMKRRVGIAQALLGTPKLIIVDEPTSGLDPEERVRLRNLLADAAQKCTVLLSTHIIEDISQSCTELAVLNQGKVRFCGSPRDLITAARGKVWLITTQGERPNSGLSIVSTLQLQDGVQYRVIGQAVNGYQAQPVEPSLEDGYIWLMREAAN